MGHCSRYNPVKPAVKGEPKKKRELFNQRDKFVFARGSTNRFVKKKSNVCVFVKIVRSYYKVHSCE